MLPITKWKYVYDNGGQESLKSIMTNFFPDADSVYDKQTLPYTIKFYSLVIFSAHKMSIYRNSNIIVKRNKKVGHDHVLLQIDVPKP